MKLSVDSERCQGHSLCCMSAAEIFDIGDEGVAVVLQQPATDEQCQLALDAALNCPEQAISFE